MLYYLFSRKNHRSTFDFKHVYRPYKPINLRWRRYSCTQYSSIEGNHLEGSSGAFLSGFFMGFINKFEQSFPSTQKEMINPYKKDKILQQQQNKVGLNEAGWSLIFRCAHNENSLNETLRARKTYNLVLFKNDIKNF